MLQIIKQNFPFKISKTNKVVILGFFLNLVSLGLSFKVFVDQKPRTIGVVDMQSIISQTSQNLAKHYHQKPVPNGVMKEVIANILESINQIGSQKGLLILAKGAVLSGEEILDLTDPVIKYLESKNLEFPRTVQKGVFKYEQ
jgi:Skp family chaperone for outer membrane proteins